MMLLIKSLIKSHINPVWDNLNKPLKIFWDVSFRDIGKQL